MARIPDTEIERLKAEVLLVPLLEAAGYALKAQGKDWVMRCPLHAGDETPSLVVTPAKNVWHCFGCGQGGSVIDWVMRSRSVSFRHAVALLVRESPALIAPLHRSVRSVAPMLVPTEDDVVLLDRVIGDYHAALKQSPEALAYLAKRGLVHPELIDTFQLGYANRTLGYGVPQKNRVQGAALRGALQRIGILRDSGHEHFNGSLVVPVIDAAGYVTEVYGRKIGTNLRAGTALHLYLPGPHRGVFNEVGLVGQREIILCEALIDALTFWCAGYRNVTSAFGVSGFTDEIMAALVTQGVRRVLIAYDGDAAGDAATIKLAPRLIEHGIEPWRVVFPKGMDANSYALKVMPAEKSLALVLERAERMGVVPDAAPMRKETVPMAAPAPIEVLPLVAASSSLPAVPMHSEVLPVHDAPVPPITATSPIEIRSSAILATFGDRRYHVRGLSKNLSYEVLKVNVLVSMNAHVHVETLDLYQVKARAAFVKQAALELGIEEAVIVQDMGALLLALRAAQETAIQGALQPKAVLAEVLPIEQQEAALALLRDPRLIDRIVADVEATGVVGEASNALVAYLACVSRKLDKPLAILIQSTSAAGKSTLMDALLALMPESERVHYSAMTGQSLFYLGETSMKHKILAIAEEEGVRQAAYALKVLQSSGELTIASTGKDPVSGDMQTKTYKVEGPVMLFLTTTAIDIDEELLNRCLVLTINESREQTAAIQTRQRSSRTLEGLRTKARSEAVLAMHRAAQQLLRPLAVVNPFAEQLTFASDRVRLRRDHQKYLALIDAIALLHQHQRTIQRSVYEGVSIDYIEATLEDIVLANRLAHEVLGRSLDELPPQTRRLLGQVQQFVAERAQAQAIERSAVRFTRRELRAACGLTDTALRVHLDRLIDLEYVLVHRGGAGARFVYALAFDGDVQSHSPQLIGLLDPEALCVGRSDKTLQGKSKTLQGVKANLAPTLHPVCTPLAPTLQGDEIPRIARADADLSSLVAALDQTALLEPPRVKPSRRNGSAHPQP